MFKFFKRVTGDIRHWKKKDRGAGDTVARVTSALGVKPCGGCKKRQEELNKAVPYSENAERDSSAAASE